MVHARRTVLAAVLLATVLLATVLLAPLAQRAAAGNDAQRLPNTDLLDWQGDLSVRMMDGLNRYIEAKIAESVDARKKYWNRDPSTREAYEKSILPNRERFKTILGIVEPRESDIAMLRYGDEDNPDLVAQTDRYRVFQVRWPAVSEAVGQIEGDGLLIEPRDKPAALVVAIPDADQTPEQLVGLAPGIAAESQFARRLAESGVLVVIPTLIDRDCQWSGHPRVAWTNQPHREWIHRQAYHMGRHLIGYEVQKVSAAIDWLDSRARQANPDAKIGVAGYGEGGLIAFYAAAADPRVDACLVSGYFAPRTRPWEEPIYRNVWSLLREFGDAEIATLIAPRSLVIEYSSVPNVTGPPAAGSGRRGGAAAGQLDTPAFGDVLAEFQRIDSLVSSDFQPRRLVRAEGDKPIAPGSPQAVQTFATLLGVPESAPPTEQLPTDLRKSPRPADRQRRQVKQLQRHIQSLVRAADRTRDDFFLSKIDAKPEALAKFIKQTPYYRRKLWEDILGKLEDPLLPINARSRKIYDRPKWEGFEVVLDVLPDVFAWGVLLVPKDIQPGERRPVVVCQHGRGGVPRDVIEGDQAAYHDFAARLAERGFITFAPHNPYRGEDRYRYLSRKANSVGASLFSFILAQHEQILNFLVALPNVDPQRIAFYGLSYGGETAVRVPPLLDRYCLSICSADFNDWARKVASTDARYSFMFTEEWEMPYFNMGSTFNYFEMSALMIPRPFMVERGHSDGVAPDEWIAYEYAKVRRLYDQFELGDRTEIEFFTGGHTINGQGTFRFLEKHLRWPEGAEAN